MRHLNLLVIAVTMTISSAMMAMPAANPADGIKSISAEIEKMLVDSELTIEESVTVKVFFSVAEGKSIKIRSINSENPEVQKFLKKRLENRKLLNNKWMEGKLYELPVRIEAVK